MVHSGSAAGGHYYAHIKSFSDGQWYSFNDQHVSKVSLWLWVTRVTQLLRTWFNKTFIFVGSFSASFLAFLLDRSLKMISGRHMGGPQGAEVITPVPLQGWFCTSHDSYKWLGRYKNNGFLFIVLSCLCTFYNNRREPNPLYCPDVHPFFVKTFKADQRIFFLLWTCCHSNKV